MQGHSFCLAVRLNTGFGVRFLYPTLNDCALGALVQRFYWLANQSHVFRGLDPHKRRFRKEHERLKSWSHSKRLKGGSADGRFGALATPFATTTTLRRVLNLTVHSNSSLFKTDSGLAVIASQLITELKVLVVVVIVAYDSFFIIVRSAYDKLPDFFRMGTFIDSIHMKL